MHPSFSHLFPCQCVVTVVPPLPSMPDTERGWEDAQTEVDSLTEADVSDSNTVCPN